MKLRGSRERFVREEGGFTLPEMLVTIMIMIVVLFALYNIFDMGLRVFSFGNSKVEAIGQARLGLERMEREIRAAYPVDKTASSPKDHVFFTAGSSATPMRPGERSITFGNDVSIEAEATTPPNRKIEPEEEITYELKQRDKKGNLSTCPTSGTDGVCVLVRRQGPPSTAPFQDVADYVVPNGLTFTYLKSVGPDVAATAADGTDINVVRIELDVEVGDDVTQTLTTDVALRNAEGALPPSSPTPPPPPPPSDTTPPDTTITSGPSGTGNSTTADFGFTSTESGSTFECRLDSGSWSTCGPSSKQYTGLSAGSHTFEVRAKDAAGNVDPSPASRTWTVGPPQCSDGIDNDGDKKIDYPRDNKCSSASDNDESR